MGLGGWVGGGGVGGKGGERVLEVFSTRTSNEVLGQDT